MISKKNIKYLTLPLAFYSSLSFSSNFLDSNYLTNQFDLPCSSSQKVSFSKDIKNALSSFGKNSGRTFYFDLNSDGELDYLTLKSDRTLIYDGKLNLSYSASTNEIRDLIFKNVVRVNPKFSKTKRQIFPLDGNSDSQVLEYLLFSNNFKGVNYKISSVEDFINVASKIELEKYRQIYLKRKNPKLVCSKFAYFAGLELILNNNNTLKDDITNEMFFGKKVQYYFRERVNEEFTILVNNALKNNSDILDLNLVGFRALMTFSNLFEKGLSIANKEKKAIKQNLEKTRLLSLNGKKSTKY